MAQRQLRLTLKTLACPKIGTRSAQTGVIPATIFNKTYKTFGLELLRNLPELAAGADADAIVRPIGNQVPF
ncbi:hypothetical protein IFM47457_00518 [Aspergillus lentulus]|nr:hypothetical protein IFM47457_00518 [Aspergillus lentulus]